MADRSSPNKYSTRSTSSKNDDYNSQRDDDNKKPPTRQTSNVTSGSTVYSAATSNSGFQQNDSNDQHGSQDIWKLNEKTLDLVKDFKRKIQDNIRPGQPVVKPWIELTVANIRYDKDPERLDVGKWSTKLSSNLRNCPSNTLRLLTAYGDDPEQLKTVLQLKIKENKQNVGDQSSKPSTDTSLDQIIEPLKRINKNVGGEPLPTLFRAVLDVQDDEIDRADRMFCSEVRRQYPQHKSYRFEDAHDVVQAIRLLNYEKNGKEDLTYLVESCKNFDDAYSYLRERTKQHMQSSKVRPPSSTNRHGDPTGARDDDDSNSSSTSKPDMASSKNYQSPTKSGSSPSGYGNAAGSGTGGYPYGNSGGGSGSTARSNTTGGSTSPRYSSTTGKGTTDEQRGNGSGGSDGTDRPFTTGGGTSWNGSKH